MVKVKVLFNSLLTNQSGVLRFWKATANILKMQTKHNLFFAGFARNVMDSVKMAWFLCSEQRFWFLSYVELFRVKSI